MAGGMGRGRSGLTLAERIAGTSAAAGTHTTVNTPPHHPRGPGKNYGETADYRDVDGGPRHVWVLTEGGRNPGLLLEWRKPDQLPWEAHVVHMRPHRGRWVHVDEWVQAGSVEPA